MSNTPLSELSSMALETESAPASPTHAPQSILPSSRHSNNTFRKSSMSSGNLIDKASRTPSSHHGSTTNLSSYNPLRPSSADSPATPQPAAGPGALPLLPVSITFDMRNVLAMTEVKTEIGWVP